MFIVTEYAALMHFNGNNLEKFIFNNSKRQIHYTFWIWLTEWDIYNR